MIRGVKFASVPVTDQDRALAFYTEKLGFRLLTDQPFSEKQRWVELGISGTETRIVLFRSDDGLQPGAKMNITFGQTMSRGQFANSRARGWSL